MEESQAQQEALAKILYQNIKHKKKNDNYAATKSVLALLGTGAMLAASILAPKTSRVFAKEFASDAPDWDEWKKFNLGYLKQTLRRLEQQKLVEIQDVGGAQKIIITQKGRKRILQYSISELSIPKPGKWDRRWRVVIYDIPKNKKRLQELIRGSLKYLGFLAVQNSVYIYPYPCDKEIEFLREYYHVGSHLKYLVVEKFEDDVAYKTYFGLGK